MRRYFATLALAGLVAATGSAAAIKPTTSLAATERSSASERFVFDVYYNDRRIGEHEFQVQRQDGEVRVQSLANFVVRLLFVPVYRYRHEAQELWQSGCLQSLESTTNDNGDRFALALQPEPSTASTGLRLSKWAPEPTTVTLTDPCPATFAYWDLELLQRGQLINTQTGDVGPAQLIDQGTEPLGGTMARRFTLDVEDTGQIDLWYRASDHQWLGLATQRDGGTLRYRART